jgi:hypothetical protein
MGFQCDQNVNKVIIIFFFVSLKPRALVNREIQIFIRFLFQIFVLRAQGAPSHRRNDLMGNPFVVAVQTKHFARNSTPNV